MIPKKIAVLGAGNIGLAIAEGICRSKIVDAVSITRKSGKFTRDEKKKFKCTVNNRQAVSSSEIIILAVQPRQIDEIISEIKDVLAPRHLLISVVSGASIKRIEELGGDIPIARAMPNTAIRVGESMTCLAFNDKGVKYKSLVENIFNSVGVTLMIPEKMFAEATVLCGSGVAFGLRFLRAYMQAAIQHGFHKDEALLIAGQVLKGAAVLVRENGTHPEAEIDLVTTPNGCTISAIAEMEHGGFNSAVLKTIDAGVNKARGLYS